MNKIHRISNSQLNKSVRGLPPQARQIVRSIVKGQGVPAKLKAFNSFNGLENVTPFTGSGFGPIVPGSAQVSQSTTIIQNLRLYLISNFRTVLAQAYAEIGLIQTIVDVPVDDALRGGIEIKSKQLDEEQVAELQRVIKRKKDLRVAGQAAKWSRLHGGGGIMPFIMDQDPEEPLNIEAIGPDTDLKFRAADLWELYWSTQAANNDGDISGITVDPVNYDYYGHKWHPSRVFKMVGLEAPSWLRPRLRGWGMSVVEKLVRSINQYLKGQDLIFEVTDEFKIDYYLLKGLAAAMATPNGKFAVQERLAIMNMMKNYQSGVALDSEDKFEQKQITFSGLAEIAAGNRIQIAADMRMPLTKLFGISAAGFNSGEDDIEVYNSMVEGEPRSQLEEPILKMLELRCQQLFGFIPDDLEFSFKPLRILSAVDEEAVKTQQFTRVLQTAQANRMTDEEFRDAVNKANLLPMDLDNSPETLAALEALKPVPADGLEGVEEKPKAGEKPKNKAPEPPKVKKPKEV
jgi:phage-related protein (TIGR01555 family)